MQKLTSAVLVGALLLGCQTATVAPVGPASVQVMVADRLLFGRSIPGGGTVSDAEWDDFLRTVVTPRFPDGLSIWSGQGQWRDAKGEVVREDSFAIEVHHKGGAENEASIAAIAEEYKKRFRQEAVMRVTSSSRVRFY